MPFPVFFLHCHSLLPYYSPCLQKHVAAHQRHDLENRTFIPSKRKPYFLFFLTFDPRPLSSLDPQTLTLSKLGLGLVRVRVRLGLFKSKGFSENATLTFSKVSLFTNSKVFSENATLTFSKVRLFTNSKVFSVNACLTFSKVRLFTNS